MSTSLPDEKIASTDENGNPGLIAHNPDTGEITKIFAKDGMLFSLAQNITSKFRDAFEQYIPATTQAEITKDTKWLESKANGDIIALDGNAASASYLVISKSPLLQNTESSIETVVPFEMPLEMSVGLHMSQRVIGTEAYVEVIDTDTPIATPDEIAVTSIQQAGTVLTITTPSPHGYVHGKRFCIADCSDSRMNYPNLVVSAIVSPNQFQATAGAGGTIPSLTVGPFASGKIVFRPPFNGTQNGANMCFENTSATNASLYIKSEGGDSLPSGTITGNHSTTIGSTSSVQLVNAAYAYAFGATTEFRMIVQADRVQWHDGGVDSLAETTSRLPRTQVIPNPGKKYKLRTRMKNVRSLTIPVGQILSITKTSNTVSRIVFAAAHGLTIADQINLFGVRDQTANVFPNITTATAITTIVNTTTIDIAHGTAGSGAVSYGGFVSRVNGGINQQGVLGQIIQSATLTTNAAGTRVLTLIGSAAWTGALIGDWVNIVAVRNIVDGSPIGVDGAFRIRNIATTSLELEPLPGTTLGADFASVNCGGAVIKRTDVRLSFVRIFDYERERVEMLSRPAGDSAGAAPVAIKSGSVTVSGNPAVVGQAAEDAAATASPVIVGGVVRTATAPTTLVAGDVARDTMTAGGAKVIKPFAVAETEWGGNLALTTTTDTAAKAAAGASIKNQVTSLWAINTGASAVDLIIKDGTTERHRYTLPVNIPVPVEYPTGIVVTANTALNVALSAAGTVRLNIHGYISV